LDVGVAPAALPVGESGPVSDAADEVVGPLGDSSQLTAGAPAVTVEVDGAPAVAVDLGEARVGVGYTKEEHAWVYYHNTYNHSDDKVRRLVEAGIIKAAKPLGFRCKACALAKQHRQSFHKSRDNARLILPFEQVETDLYGPVLCDDPRGLKYMVAYLEKRSGHVFAQAVQRKSDSVKVLGAYDKWFRKVKSTVEETYGCNIFLGEERSDRGGEYTGSNTTKETEYDALSRTVFNSRRFGSAGTSQTAAPSMERF
jgi:hypothetical protein